MGGGGVYIYINVNLFGGGSRLYKRKLPRRIQMGNRPTKCCQSQETRPQFRWSERTHEMTITRKFTARQVENLNSGVCLRYPICYLLFNPSVDNSHVIHQLFFIFITPVVGVFNCVIHFIQ